MEFSTRDIFQMHLIDYEVGTPELDIYLHLRDLTQEQLDEMCDKHGKPELKGTFRIGIGWSKDSQILIVNVKPGISDKENYSEPYALMIADYVETTFPSRKPNDKKVEA